MKILCIFILILSFLPRALTAIFIDTYYFPDDQITVTEEKFFNDLLDGSQESFDNFDAFLIASGIVSKDEIQFYQDRFQQIEKSVRSEIVSNSNQNIPKAKIILKWLHENFFKHYKKDTRGIHDLINKGEYDCLSSSIIYYILAVKLELDIRFIKVPEHVFCQVYQPQNSYWINVETTSPYGYNPGEAEIIKMEKKIVKTYLPKTEYSNKETIEFFPLLSYVILERNSLESDGGNSRDQEYTIEHLYIFKKALFFDFKSNLLSHNIKALLIKFGNVSLEAKEYSKALIFINEGLKNYQGEYTFQQLHVNYYLKKANDYYVSEDYTQAVLILEQAFEKYPCFDNISQNLTAYITAWGNDYFEALNFEKAIEVYEYGLEKPINYKTLENNVKSCYYNLANEKFRSYELDKAVEICIEARSKYPSDYNLKELHKTILYNSAIVHLNSDNLTKARYYCETGMREFPEYNAWSELEEKINRAYKIYYYNSAAYEYNNQNYETAYKFCIKGLKIDTKSKDLDRDLKELKKKCEFWL